MATQVLIAHTGQRLEIDTSQFQAYDYISPPTLECFRLTPRLSD